MKKIKLIDIVKSINLDGEKMQSDVDWDDLASELELDKYGLYFEQERLKAYFIEKWYCTDSYVGYRAYFFDGKFVALSYQVGRKYDEVFEFVSVEDAQILKDYIKSLIGEEEEVLRVSILDVEQEIDEFHKIEYNSQILHKSAYYNGEKVQIIKSNYQSEGHLSDNYFHSVEIEISKGITRIVDCRELLFSRFSLD